MEALREEIRRDLMRPFLRGYRLGTDVVMLMLVVLVPYHALHQDDPVRMACSLTTAVAAGVLLVLCGAHRCSQWALEHMQLLIGATSATLTILVLVNLGLRQDLRLTSHLALLMVLNAIIFFEGMTLVAANLLVMGLWGVVVYGLEIQGDLGHWVVAFAAGSVVSYAFHSVLDKLLRTQEEGRFQDHLQAQAMARLNHDLMDALEHVKTLRGLVPICGQCKKVRDDEGFWQKVETFVEAHSHAEFTHGLCPECLDALKAEFEALPAGPQPSGTPSS